MRDHQEELRKRQVEILVVTFEGDLTSRSYVEATSLSWPLVIDEPRELYRNYGMQRASFWDIWGPKTWWVYLKELVKGNRPSKSAADIRQRGGDILIDPDGIIRLHHIGQGPADRPALGTILQIIDEWHRAE